MGGFETYPSEFYEGIEAEFYTAGSSELGTGLFAYLEYQDMYEDQWTIIGGCFNLFNGTTQNVAFAGEGIYFQKEIHTLLFFFAKKTGWDGIGNGLNDCVFALAVDTTHEVLYAGGMFTSDTYGVVNLSHVAVADVSVGPFDTTWE